MIGIGILLGLLLAWLIYLWVHHFVPWVEKLNAYHYRFQHVWERVDTLINQVEKAEDCIGVLKQRCQEIEKTQGAHNELFMDIYQQLKKLEGKCQDHS